MKLPLAALAAALLTVTACSTGDDTTTPADTTTVTDTSTATTEPEVRKPGQPIQVDIFVRAVGEMYASTGQPTPSQAEALEFANSMCNFLDAGNSPYDAVQLLNDEGYPPEYTGDLVPKAIAAACTEHLS